MFVKNKVIDNEKIKEVIEGRSLITVESLKKELNDICEITKSEEIEINPDDVSFIEYYDLAFSTSIMYLSLDELEFINENNLFELDGNNMLDYHCQKGIERRITDYKQTLANLASYMEKSNLGSYFQGYQSLFKMDCEGLKIKTILGLDRENIELTSEGQQLKTTLDNIHKLYIQSKTNTSPKRR